ncbi:MAG: peroxidase family protein, partial [Nocardioides sp.]
ARRQDPESIRNFRIPALDLDSVYGGGPGVSPQLYDRTVDGGRTTMLTEEIPGSGAVSVDGSARRDLPRNSQLVALTGDPRNDENLIVSQLHLALLRFHKVVIADVKAELGAGFTADEIFAEAQRIVRWHYQWLILREFLPATVGAATADDVLTNGRKHYKWRNDPFISVEFSVAAYRVGHSQVRPSYRANFGTSGTDPTQQFFALIFDPAAADPSDPADLRGGVRAPRRFIDWQTFFDFGDGRVKQNKKIDATLSSVLFNLMGQPPGTATSLASRNLLRALTMSVPSGQRVARAMNLPELVPGDLQDLEDLSLHLRTPLWFYVLREADVMANGEHLGPVGGRIVAEVLVGLIEGDRQSYLRQDPDWTPTYGSNDDFTIADLLNTAGVVATIA